jgi:hypothetical protein
MDLDLVREASLDRCRPPLAPQVLDVTTPNVIRWVAAREHTVKPAAALSAGVRPSIPHMPQEGMHMRKRTRAIGVGTSIMLLATGIGPVFGASHREAPTISTDAAADHTDVFAWVDGETNDRVNLVVNVSPMQDPAGGPNFWLFDPAVKYDINIDNDGDGRADVTFSWRFTTHIRDKGTFLSNTGVATSPNDPDINVYQTYNLTKTVEGRRPTTILKNAFTAPINVGPRATPDYADIAAAAVRTKNGIKAFAGQRDDPFFVDLGSIFDLGGLRPFNGFHVIPLAPAEGIDDLQGLNVLTLALQVPISQLTKGNAVYAADDARATIGVWAANYRQSVRIIQKDGSVRTSGAWRQVSRMANPLINEVIIPIGLKDLWNSRSPRGDKVFEKYYLKPELAGLINALYPALPDTRTTGRSDLSLILLQGLPGLNSTGSRLMDVLRLNTGIPACTADPADDDSGDCRRLGAFYEDKADLAAWPNGRRPSDDVTDMALRAVADGYGAQLNALYGVPNLSPNNTIGDGVDANDNDFLTAFPFIALPNQGYDHEHHRGNTPL